MESRADRQLALERCERAYTGIGLAGIGRKRVISRLNAEGGQSQFVLADRKWHAALRELMSSLEDYNRLA
jgi:hypothetical protein